VSVAEAYIMVEMLERFWMQQDDSGIPFVAASQKMKDNVSMIRTKQLVQRNIDNFSSASSSVLSKMFPLISTFFWCHMYDVLVYKMLWDWKKILNISLWRIIILSMRPTTGMCPHISLEKILVYIVLV
jgi:hypothetical protein